MSGRPGRVGPTPERERWGNGSSARFAAALLLAWTTTWVGADQGPSGRSAARAAELYARARAAFAKGETERAYALHASASLPDSRLEEPIRRALDRVNHHRRFAMLPPVVADPRVTRAAAAHAAYLDRHAPAPAPGVPIRLREVHGEEPDRPGFTGRTAAERVAAQGLAGRVDEVISFGIPEPEAAVDHLMNTVFHRIGLLRPAGRRLGHGVGRDTVLDLVREGDVDGVFCYPGPGQQDVPPRFPGGEAPDPLPDAAYPVGPPLSVMVARGDPEVLSARLVGPSGEVRLKRIDRTTGPRPDLLEGCVFFVPEAPLEPGTEYEARFRLVGSERRIVFTTGREVPGEERLTASFPRLTVTPPVADPGEWMQAEVELVASHPDRVRVEWRIAGAPAGEGRRIRWKAGEPGTHQIEVRATYPPHPTAAARRGAFFTVRDPVRREALGKPLGLSFHPSAPWTAGTRVRLSATPLHMGPTVRYQFSVDGRLLGTSETPEWTWIADGRHDHRFEVVFRFPGGKATRSVEQVPASSTADRR